ncbi:hypothetical protein HG1285_16296 [Hydrogenivirga sp. 128-5-R1-1]|nr:hypothetical protein HG1285_16296 [Hydrogenivirga sp. 128-5-R1-1]
MNLYEVVGTLGLLVVVALLIYMAWTIKKMPEEAEKH